MIVREGGIFMSPGEAEEIAHLLAVTVACGREMERIRSSELRGEISNAVGMLDTYARQRRAVQRKIKQSVRRTSVRAA